MYGMPQPNTYGQYGFNAYGGFPGQGGATGTPGAAAPGMGSPVAGAAGMAMGAGAGGADPNAGAGQAQGQWGAGTDPSSYYSNYWGGEYHVGYTSVSAVLTEDARLLRTSRSGRGSYAPGHSLSAYFSVECSM